MYVWDVFYENADTDDPKEWIGTIQADSGDEALQKASEFWEIPSHDLIVKQIIPDSSEEKERTTQ